MSGKTKSVVFSFQFSGIHFFIYLTKMTFSCQLDQRSDPTAVQTLALLPSLPIWQTPASDFLTWQQQDGGQNCSEAENHLTVSVHFIISPPPEEQEGFLGASRCSAFSFLEESNVFFYWFFVQLRFSHPEDDEDGRPNCLPNHLETKLSSLIWMLTLADKLLWTDFSS